MMAQTSDSKLPHLNFMVPTSYYGQKKEKKKKEKINLLKSILNVSDAHQLLSKSSISTVLLLVNFAVHWALTT